MIKKHDKKLTISMLGGYNVRKFDTNVQELKYKVLREIARLQRMTSWRGYSRNS